MTACFISSLKPARTDRQVGRVVVAIDGHARVAPREHLVHKTVVQLALLRDHKDAFQRLHGVLCGLVCHVEKGERKRALRAGCRLAWSSGHASTVQPPAPARPRAAYLVAQVQSAADDADFIVRQRLLIILGVLLVAKKKKKGGTA